LTGELLKAFEANIESLSLIPSSGGVFEVEVDGKLIFSKKELGRHAATGEVVEAVRGLIGDTPHEAQEA
jgi:selenoprotein W-related protein